MMTQPAHWRRLGAALLLTLVVTLPAASLAAESIDLLPQPAQISQRLELLQSQTNETSQQLRDNYQTLLRQLQSIASSEQQADQYRTLMAEFPARLQTLKAQLIPGELPSPPLPAPGTSLDALQQQLSLNNAHLVEQQSQYDALVRTVTTIDNRLQQLPGLLAELKRRLNELVTAPPGQLPQGELGESLRLLEHSLQAELSARIKALELEQLSASNRRDLAEAEQQLVKQQITLSERQIAQLQQAVAAAHQQQSEAAMAASRQLIQQNHAAPVIRTLLTQNQQYTQQLQTLTQAISSTVGERSELQGRQRVIEDLRQRINEQLNHARTSSITGAALRAEMARLPASYAMQDLDARLDKAQLQQYLLEQQVVQLESAASYIAQYENLSGEQVEPGVSGALEPLLAFQRELVAKLRHNYANYIQQLAQLELDAQQLNHALRELRSQIDEHLLWLPNALPISSDWLSQLSQNFAWLLTRLSPQELIGSVSADPKRLAAGAVLLLFCGTLGWMGRRRLPRVEQRGRQALGKVTQDRFALTLHLLVAISLYALPLPLLVYGSGNLIGGAHPFTGGLATGMHWIAVLLYLHCWWHHASRPASLLRVHFGWKTLAYDTLRIRLRNLVLLASPLLLLVAIGEDPTNSHLNNGVGRAAFILLCLLTSYSYHWTLAQRHWQPPGTRRQPPLALRSGQLLLTALPLACAMLAATGYYFTALELWLNLQYTLLLIIAGLLLHATLSRWLLIEARRMAFTRAKARRAEQLAQRDRSSDAEEAVLADSDDDNLIDLRTISEHSQVLLRTLIILSAALCIGLLWSDLIRSLNFLDQVTIWEGTAGSDGESSQLVTLKQIILAIGVIGLTLIAVRNLPGVMEIVVLQHLTLAPGTGYAITTLLRYLLIASGTLASFYVLGFEWAKLQWLVAALGVGLGFGLQEIFANFVSGLILLFERPIRIGDTVTINELSGTVTKIQIRATTIVDWDRKEIIVPNKAFITDKLVNWSLSDAVTRLVVPVGVAYGSDNALVTRLLLEAAESIPQVLRSPKPEAFFIAFGASSLDFELRLYISELALRFPVRHAIHQRIDQLFREHQIEIAFPQLDVHLKRN